MERIKSGSTTNWKDLSLTSMSCDDGSDRKKSELEVGK